MSYVFSVDSIRGAHTIAGEGLKWERGGAEPLTLTTAYEDPFCFAFAPNVTFTTLRQWLVPAVADEPTAHVVPFLCPLYKLFCELVSCIIK